MDECRISSIRVNKQTVGIVGLEAAIASVHSAFSGAPTDRIKEELLRRLSSRNYIPGKMRGVYADAFLREYRKFCGTSSEDQTNESLEIEILGPGCPQCNRMEMEMEIMSVLTELDLPADVRHVRDIKEIGTYGIMGMPALVIDGRVVATGTVLTQTRLKALLKEAAVNRGENEGRAPPSQSQF